MAITKEQIQELRKRNPYNDFLTMTARWQSQGYKEACDNLENMGKEGKE